MQDFTSAKVTCMQTNIFAKNIKYERYYVKYIPIELTCGAVTKASAQREGPVTHRQWLLYV